MAFLEFLEGKHGIHANPLNYTLLLNNPPGAPHGGPLLSDPGALRRRPREERTRAVLAFPWARLGAPCLPGAPRTPRTRSRGANGGRRFVSS